MNAPALPTLVVVCSWFVLGLRPCSAQQKQLWIGGSDAGYIEAASCRECHLEIAASYARTGMARSFGRMHEGTPFPEGSYRHAASEQDFSAYRRDGKPYIKRTLPGPDGTPSYALEREVHYWFGSGNHARSYIHRTGSGKLVELPITRYGGGWAMSPGYDRPDHSGSSRKLNYRCLFCHAGYPRIEPGSDDWDGATQFPGPLTEGIDCQRCHGPGRGHAAAARSGQPVDRVRSTIVNPARLAPDRKMEVCLQCHLETTTLRLPSSILRYGRGVFSYRPGEPLEDYLLYFDHANGTGHEAQRALSAPPNGPESRGLPERTAAPLCACSLEDKFEFVSEAYRMRQSQCFLKSGGALTCTTCHNPHDVPRGAEAARRYTAACLVCHSQKIGVLIQEKRHPVSRDCVACHMPKRQPSDAAHVRVADHRILRRPPEESLQPSIEHNDSTTPPYRGEVALYYPPTLPDIPETSLYLAVAQVRHQSNLDKGLPLLDSLVRRLRPAQPGFYFDLGEAWRAVDRLDKALAYHEESVRRGPGHWRHLYALGLTLARTGPMERAVKMFEQAAVLAPTEPAILQALGESLSRNGKPREAAAAFQRAIVVDGDFAEAYNNLATSLLRLGNNGAAEKALRQAVVLRPEMATIRINLASFLARHPGFPEAKHHFEAVLRMNPSFAEGRSAYGTALAARGQADAALAQYEKALSLNPALPVTQNNVAAILAQRGQAEQAIRAYREAVRYAPHYFEAHWKLGELLLKTGQREEAEKHLRKAAASPDTRIRDAAGRLLRQR